MAKTNTAIAVSSAIEEVIQKQALATRLTQKEVVYLGMLAIDALVDTPLAKAEGILVSQNRLADAELLQHQ